MTTRKPMNTFSRQSGFTLIEILVSLAIGLVLLAGVIQIYAGTKSSYQVQDGMSRLQENARYAMYLVERDMRMTSFLGCPQRKIRDGNPLEESLPEDLRITYRNMLNAAAQSSYLWDMTSPLRGFDGNGSNDAMTLLDTADANEGVADTALQVGASDVLSMKVVRGLGASLTASITDETDLPVSVPGSTTLSNGDNVVLITDCQKTAVVRFTYVAATGKLSRSTAGASTASASVVGDYSLPGDGGSALGDFGIGTKIFPIDTITYYVRNYVRSSNDHRDHTATETRPGLWRRVNDETLGSNEDRLIVEGLENLQITYGLDTSTNRSNRADRFVTADAVPDTDIDDDTDPDWHRVVSVRLGMLLATPDAIGDKDHSDTFTIDGQSITTDSDRRLRRVFNTTVTLRNVAS